MYSPLVVDQAIFALQKAGHKVKRRSIEESLTISGRFAKLINPDGAWERPLTDSEAQFIRSETALCKVDFRYWATRYGTVARDGAFGGGVGPVEFWESQERALELISKRQEEITEEHKKYGFSNGVLSVWHKSRQLGATTIMRLICGHRRNFYKYTRSIVASLDVKKVDAIYTKDKLILDNLPVYMRPKVEYDVKDSHIGFEVLKSKLLYQQANQEAGIGTGEQFDISHMTEVALWDNPYRLGFEFFPAIPQSPMTFVALESTANGRGGFWHEHTENVRLRKEGFTSWTYIFTPWYIESRKYRDIPPTEWTPNKITTEHADLVEKTSAEYTGKTVRLSRDQLRWWETQYKQYKENGTLPQFLSNYSATPEQSFQHSSGSALPLETLEWMRATAKMGMPYDLAAMQVRA